MRSTPSWIGMESISFIVFLLWTQSVAMPETACSCLEIYEEGITNKCPLVPLVLVEYNDVVLCITWKIFERKVIKENSLTRNWN